MLANTLIEALRRRIKDDRKTVRALDLALSDTTVSSAIAEITRGHLIVTVSGSTETPATPSIDVDLGTTRYSTVEGLYQHLQRVPGYVVRLDEDADLSHSTLDFLEFGPSNIRTGNGLVLTHYNFSNEELEQIITSAARRHNPSLTFTTIPNGEQELILHLAQADVCRIQAMNSAKRRSTGADTSTLLQLADTFERTYSEDVSRLARSIQSPREANPNLMGEGDVVLGSLFRRSLRTGYNAQMAGNTAPDIPVLLPYDVRDVEDENVRVNWQRNRNSDFFSYELWMDTRPEVIRNNRETDRQTSSTMVYRALGPNGTNWMRFSTVVEETGQLIRSFVVKELEPDMTYYFRLFIADINREMTGSEVLMVRTLPLRARFADTSPVSPTYGAAGTVVTLTFDSEKGAFTANHKVFLGGKQVAATVVSATEATIVVPSFVKKGLKDLVVESPTGLIDVLANAFEVTS